MNRNSENRFAISIHALREEGDAAGNGTNRRMGNFYPRPPRGGRLCMWTSAARPTRYFYPRPPRGGRRFRTPFQRYLTVISIHALREEGDFGGKLAYKMRCDFYPRPPRGGRHFAIIMQECRHKFLSTPSARRATARYVVYLPDGTNFYPRPPRGGRL